MAVASVMPVTCTGTELSRFVPLPSCPYRLSPQQDMVPSWWSAQECPWLALPSLSMAMAVASVMPETCTGTQLFRFVPLPSCPYRLSPQQDMVPSWWSAQEKKPVVSMAVASSMPVTGTGTAELLFVPLPSSP